MPQLHISLLGAPVITVGRKAVITDTRKATALLAYLAVSGQPQRRATLAALLWPDTDEEKARGALRRTLSVLRSALGDRWLEADGDTMDLGHSGLRVDVRDFRRAIADGRLEEAARLYRGDLLEGFSLRDSPDFDDWQAGQADALRSDFADVLSRLAETAERTGDLPGALGYAKRRLATDALHEPAHRELMRLYAVGGDRPGALGQYRECARLLDRELGSHRRTRPAHCAMRSRRAHWTTARPRPRWPRHQRWASCTPCMATIAARSRATKPRPRTRRRSSAEPSSTVLLRSIIGAGTGPRPSATTPQHARPRPGRARRRILADWSLATHRSGDEQRAKRLTAEALKLAERSGDTRALAQAHNILGILATGRSALTHLETSVALAQELGDREAQVAALNNLALALKEAGRLDRARSLTEEALAECETIGDRHRTAALHNNLADILRAQGHKDEAMRHLKRAVRLFSEIGEAGTSEPEVWKLVGW